MKAFSSRTYKVLICRIITFYKLHHGYALQPHLHYKFWPTIRETRCDPHQYHTAHRLTEMPLYWGGTKTPNPSFLQRHTHSFAGLSYIHTRTQEYFASITGQRSYIGCQGSCSFNPTSISIPTPHLSAVVVTQLLYLFFFSSSKQHTTHFHKRKYSKW